VVYKMTIKRNLSYLICFLTVCYLIFCFAHQGSTQESKTFKSAKDVFAADFILKDFTGKDYRLSDYKGKIILLNFMTTWCPGCRASVPYLKSIYTQFNRQGLIILNINVMESEGKVADFSQKIGLPYPTLMDREGVISRNYGVVGVPLKVLIDRKGRIICWNCRTLDKLLDKQFAGIR
jgi:peroxiredoxin